MGQASGKLRPAETAAFVVANVALLSEGSSWELAGQDGFYAQVVLCWGISRCTAGWPGAVTAVQRVMLRLWPALSGLRLGASH
jgi:hypothetical protein